MDHPGQDWINTSQNKFRLAASCGLDDSVAWLPRTTSWLDFFSEAHSRADGADSGMLTTLMFPTWQAD